MPVVTEEQEAGRSRKRVLVRVWAGIAVGAAAIVSLLAAAIWIPVPVGQERTLEVGGRTRLVVAQLKPGDPGAELAKMFAPPGLHYERVYGPGGWEGMACFRAGNRLWVLRHNR